MAELKNSKYILTEFKKPLRDMPKHRAKSKFEGSGYDKHILYLDSEIIEGAFYLECVWFTGDSGGYFVEKHAHSYDEVITFFGSDADDPYNLNGEVEIWLEDEKYLLTKSCIIFVPKGLVHCPLSINRVDKPIFHFSCGTNKSYLK
jgi:quercetin dioxygenase-like cupin family protein